MNFLYKLFPYRSFFHIDGDTLTAWWVLMTIVIFLVYLFRLLSVAGRLRKKLDLLTKNFSVDLIDKDVLFTQVWRDYQESFIDFLGNKKTDEYSYDYFNEKNLFSANTNLKLINSIPATLVGLGILGTFIGLTYGISNFQTSSTEQIKESIETLLSGMGTAFVSSIYGMLLSLVFTFFEKVQVNSLHNSIHSLCYNLDKQYKISKEDERIIEFKRQERLLHDYFIFKDDNGNDVKPGNVFRDIHNENRKQSIALQSFSTDLANLIEAGFEKILNDPDKKELQMLVNQLKESTDLMKLAIETEMQKLGDKLQDAPSDMIETVVEDLKSALGNMVTDFKETVSGTTKGEIEKLTELLHQAGNHLNAFPDKIQEMTVQINENFMGLQKVVENTSKTTLDQAKEANRVMNGQVLETGNILSKHIGKLQENEQELLNKQGDLIEKSKQVFEEYRSVLERQVGLNQMFESLMDQFKESKTETLNILEQLKPISSNLSSATHNIKQIDHNLEKNISELSSKYKENLQQIEGIIQRSSKLNQDTQEKYATIDKGLHSIFQQIQKGLEEYRDTIGESVESYLEKYTKALTDAASALSNAANTQQTIQNELLGELTQQIEIINRHTRK